MQKNETELKRRIIEQQLVINALVKLSEKTMVKKDKFDITLEDAVTVWKEYAKIYHPKILNEYPRRFKFVLRYFPDKTLRTLTKQDIMNFINKRKSEGVRKRKKGTRNQGVVMIETARPVSNYIINGNVNLIASLFRAIKTMMPDKFTDLESPTRGIPKLPKTKSRKTSENLYYNSTELEILINGGTDIMSAEKKGNRVLSPAGTAVQLMCKTGCRVSEALKLKWENVNFENKKLTFLDTKNSSDRDVPLSDGLIKYLTNISFRAEHFTHVVTTTYGKPYRGYPRDVFKTYIINCGVRFKSIHAIRHGVVTALRKQYGERITKPIIGHSVSSIHEMYTHFEWSELAEAVQILDFF